MLCDIPNCGLKVDIMRMLVGRLGDSEKNCYYWRKISLLENTFGKLKEVFSIYSQNDTKKSRKI